MVKNKYISLILFLIVIVTVINLFYKPLLYDVYSAKPDVFWGTSAVTASTCPLYGFQCPTDEPCDCASLCRNEEFVPFHVMPEDTIFLMDRQLAPGTYCLPKGIGNCNQTTSYHVFSLTGWKCISRNTTLYKDDTLMACQNEEATDNSQNVLWDYLLNQPATDIENVYETLADGKTLRYRCQCNSLDIRGKPLISTLPFVCSVDYCIKDIIHPLPVMGFRGSKCECATYLHEDPNDELSACVMERSRVENDIFTGRVDCMTHNSWKKSAIFCPEEASVLSFQVPIMGGTSSFDFVAKQLQ